MKAPVAIEYRGFAGIKNDVDRASVKPPFVWSANNVDCDDNGILSRRDGMAAAVVTGDFHSGWSTADESLFLAVKGTDLVVVNADFSTSVLLSGLKADLRMVFVEVNDKVYYTNGQVYGFLYKVAKTLGSWPAITAQLGTRMPPGRLIEYYNGIMYVAVGGVVYYSMPYDFGRIELRRNFMQFPGTVTLLKAVDDGLWVSYGNETAFLRGAAPADFVPNVVAGYPALIDTAVAVNAEYLAGEQPMQGIAVMWESTRGPCMGLTGGIFINIATGKYNAPTGSLGSSVIRTNRKGTRQFISLINL